MSPLSITSLSFFFRLHFYLFICCDCDDFGRVHTPVVCTHMNFRIFLWAISFLERTTNMMLTESHAVSSLVRLLQEYLYSRQHDSWDSTDVGCLQLFKFSWRQLATTVRVGLACGGPRVLMCEASLIQQNRRCSLSLSRLVLLAYFSVDFRSLIVYSITIV